MKTSFKTALRMIMVVTQLPAVVAISWSSALPDHGTINACEGHDASFPWDLTLGAGESIADIQWFFEGNSHEMIAMFAAGNFLTMPAYSQRVQHLPMAGITLSHVTTGDAGNYVVEINAKDAAGFHNSFRKTATLVVSTGGGPSALLDATLDAAQQPGAVYDSQTGQSHVQLTCSSRRQPPASVQWISPLGTKLSSTSSSGGVFSLLLPNPVTGGSYTCRLPPNAAAVACLPPNSPALAGATVLVDETEARLAVLEGQQGVLRSENNQLKVKVEQCAQACGSSSAVTTLTAALESLKNRVTQLETGHNSLSGDNSQLTAENARLRQENANLTSQLTSLQTRVNDLERDLTAEDTRQSQLITSLGTRLDTCSQAKTHRQIGFHARLEQQVRVAATQTLKPRQVLHNLGNGYNILTGIFTAPVAGTYFIIATVSSHSMFDFSDARLHLEGTEVARMDSPVQGDVGTCQAVVSMQQGDRVWLESAGEGIFSNSTTSFTGFLIAAD
nr:hypothetical protein BaRGS_000969 [Batillaria attramentaria]